MRHRNRTAVLDSPPGRSLRLVHAIQRARVDAAYQHMQTVVARPHRPAEAREDAYELTIALSEALGTTMQMLHLLRTDTGPARPRRRRHATRTPDPVLEPWTSELMGLSEIEVWLRRTTLDDLGVHLPMSVQIGSYAATGPHIAGLDFGTDDAATLHEPRIGIVMRDVIDGLNAPASQPASTPADPAHAA